MTAALSNAALAEIAPAIFTESPDPSLSNRYHFVNTASVLDALRDNGFIPVQARQDRAVRRDPRYIRHSVVLRPRDTLDAAPIVGEATPQILLVNSHNGVTKLRLHAGMYRFVCANGMVVGDDRMKAEIGHQSTVALHVDDYINRFGEEMNDFSATVKRWSEIELNPTVARKYAREAAKLRFGKTFDAYSADDILASRRAVDEGMDLWKVFNRVQENTTKKGLRGTNANNRAVSTRDLSGITADITYNEMLWNLTRDFAEAEVA